MPFRWGREGEASSFSCQNEIRGEGGASRFDCQIEMITVPLGAGKEENRDILKRNESANRASRFNCPYLTTRGVLVVCWREHSARRSNLLL